MFCRSTSRQQDGVWSGGSLQPCMHASTTSRQSELLAPEKSKTLDLTRKSGSGVQTPKGLLKPTHFFSYSTKHGCRIIIESHWKYMRFEKELISRGYSPKQRSQFFRRLWHEWIRKIISMIWLAIAGGLPVGAWRTRMGLPGECSLYGTGALQSIEYALYSCPIVFPA